MCQPLVGLIAPKKVTVDLESSYIVLSKIFLHQIAIVNAIMETSVAILFQIL